MKTSVLIDIAFIALCLIILLPLIKFGHSSVISNFSIVFMLVAYYVGKYVKAVEVKKAADEKGAVK